MARDLKRVKLDPKLHQYRVLSVRGGGAAAEELPANKMVIGSIPAAVLALTSSDTRRHLCSVAAATPEQH